MSYSLKLKCQYCEKYGGHKVVQTAHKPFHWNDWATSLFKTIVGRDIFYRIRTRECSSCQKQFQTVEMTRDYLVAMMKEPKKLSQENEDIAQKYKNQISENELLRNQQTNLELEKKYLELENHRVKAKNDVVKEELVWLSGFANELVAVVDSEEAYENKHFE